MIGISVIPDLSNYERFEERVNLFVSGQARVRSAKVAINAILTLTREGVDAYGEFFRPYAQMTVDKRQRLGLRTDIVNHYVTGAMLGSLGANGNPDGTVTVSPSQLSKAVNTLFLGREWFGPGPFMLNGVQADLTEGVQALC